MWSVAAPDRGNVLSLSLDHGGVEQSGLLAMAEEQKEQRRRRRRASTIAAAAGGAADACHRRWADQGSPPSACVPKSDTSAS